MNKQKCLSKIALLLGLFTSLVVAESPAQAKSLQAATAVDTMIARYHEIKMKSPPGVPELGDYVQVCLAGVFQQWTEAYEPILESTPGLDPNQIKNLKDFGTLYYRTSDLVDWIERARPGIKNAVNVGFASALKANAVASMKSTPFTIGDINPDLYLVTLRQCGSTQFLASVANALKEKPGNSLLPLGPNAGPFFALWTCSAQGGLQLSRQSGSTDAPTVPQVQCAAPSASSTPAGIVAVINAPPMGPAFGAGLPELHARDYQSLIEQMREQ